MKPDRCAKLRAERDLARRENRQWALYCAGVWRRIRPGVKHPWREYREPPKPLK